MAPESKMFSYALALYEAMENEADDGVYVGKVVETFNRLHISGAHYTPLFNSLKELGCIELIERGVRGRSTRYRLHGAPTLDAYENRYQGGLTKEPSPDTLFLSELEQRVSNLERRLEGLDIKGIVVNYEERISKIEKVKGGSKK